AMYEKGMDTIASDTVCYPAKMVHGHVQDLLDKGVNRVWYPMVPWQRQGAESLGEGRTQVQIDIDEGRALPPEQGCTVNCKNCSSGGCAPAPGSDSPYKT
ncbi:hypothetical protein KIPB_007271, partial [Kipferlia bialata]